MPKRALIVRVTRKKSSRRNYYPRGSRMKGFINLQLIMLLLTAVQLEGQEIKKPLQQRETFRIGDSPAQMGFTGRIISDDELLYSVQFPEVWKESHEKGKVVQVWRERRNPNGHWLETEAEGYISMYGHYEFSLEEIANFLRNWGAKRNHVIRDRISVDGHEAIREQNLPDPRATGPYLKPPRDHGTYLVYVKNKRNDTLIITFMSRYYERFKPNFDQIISSIKFHPYTKPAPNSRYKVSGRILLRTGNCMPGSLGEDSTTRRATCKIEGVTRDIFVRRSVKGTTNKVWLLQKPELIQKTRSNDKGDYEVMLPVGVYSFFVEERGKEYCTLRDVYENACSVRLVDRPVKADWMINYASD